MKQHCLKFVMAVMVGLFFTFNANSQITVTIGSLTSCNPGDSITIPVMVTNFTAIGSISMKINYNPAVVQCAGAKNWNSNFTGVVEGVNNTSGTITESWLMLSSAVTIPDGLLFNLRFKYLGGNSAITFSTTSGDNEITNDVGVPYPVTFINGQMNAGLVAIASITPAGPTTFCDGDSVVLNTTANAGFTYQWKRGGVAISGATASSYIAKITGSYTVDVTAFCGTVVSSAVSVTVNTVPAAAGVITGTAVVCKGVSGIVYSVPVISGATGYNWTLPAGVNITAGSNTRSITVTFSASAVSGAITVLGTNTCGNGTVSANYSVTVNTVPDAAGTISGTATVCQGVSAIAYTVPVIPGATSYTWTVPSGATIASGGTTNSIIVNYSLTATSGAITVRGTNSCGNGLVSADFNITVNTAPAATIIPQTTVTFCLGGSVILDANTGAGLTYQWKVGGIDIPAAIGSSFTATASGSYTVEVTESVNLCKRLSTAQSVTVNPLPAASVIANTSVCSGSSKSIGAASVSGNTYSWVSNPVGFTSTLANPSVSPTVNTTYTLTETITATGCFKSNSLELTVDPLPVANAGINTAICLGTATVIGAPSVAGNTYSWSPSAGLSSSTFSNPIASPTVTTTYTLTETITATGCIKQNSVVVTVNPLPIANAGSNTAVCIGQATQIGAATVVGNTYSWVPAAGLFATNISNPFAGPTVTTTYTLTETITATGCSNQNNVVVTVNPLPTSIATATGSTTVCQGEVVILNANTGTGLTYQWQKNTVNIPGATAASYNAMEGGIYRVLIYDGNNCGLMSNEVTITVNPLPIATATAAGPTNICFGSSVAINANIGANLTYQWKKNAIDISGETNASYIANSSGAYTVVVTNSVTGCFATSPNAIVVINPKPTANALGSTTFCQGGAVGLLANTGIGLTYQWQKNGINIPGATSSLYSATESGNYSVMVTYSATCTDESNVIPVTVNALPVVVANTSAPAVCEGTSVILTGSGALTYVWNKNVMNGVAFAPTLTQTYIVTGTDVNMCQNTATVSVTVNPLPSVLANSSASAVCIGNSVTLTGSGATTYAWSHGVNDGIAFIPTVTTTYTVTGTDLNFCEKTATVIVTVNPLPLVVANASATTICSGSPVTLTGSGADTYVWSHGVSDGVAFIPAATTTYTVTGTSTGCTNIATVIVTVTALPTVGANTTASSVCAGAPVTLTGSGATSYAWSHGVSDGVAFIPAATTTYTVTGTSSGCSNTATVLVSVTALPAVGANTTASSVCAGAPVTLTGSGATSYVWSHGVSDGVAFNPIATTTYTVTGTSSGCSNSATVVVTVNTLPGASATAIGVTTFCTGGSVLITANTGTGLTYQWKKDAVNIIGATSSSYTATTTGSYTVLVTNSATTCAETSNAIVVTVNPLPSATATAGGATTFCIGGNVALNANTGTGLTYQWKKDGVNVSGATLASYTANSTGSYTVVVINATNCSQTSNAITVTVNPLPTATATALGSTSFCTGGSVLINANSGTGLSYQWKKDAVNISGATSSSYTATTTGSYTVLVTNSATTCSDISNAVVVTVNPLPTATVTAAGATTFCIGGNVVLNANTGTGLTYQWKKDGLDVSGATLASYTANSIGSYTVVVTNATNCSQTSSAITVTVNPLPIATATALGATNFCTGGSVLISANSGTGLTYQWKKDAVNISGATSSSYTATTTGSYTVLVTNSATTCSDISNAVVVTVNPLPTATATAAGATTFCIGGNVVLNANTGTGLTYQWKKDGMDVSGATLASYTANSTGSYTVVVTNATNCSQTSSAITVTVNPLPIANATALGVTTFCSGGSVLITANTGTGLTYQWRKDAVIIIGANSSSYTANATGAYTVVVTNSSTTCSDISNAIIVTVNPLPTATATAAGATTFCHGGNVVLNANTGTGLTYQWRKDGINITGATLASYSANASGIYTVVVTNATNCSQISSAITVTVNPLPIATAFPAGATTFCQGGSVTIIANTGTGLTYQWKKDGVNISGANASTYTATTSGAYVVVVTNASTCSETSNTITVTVNTLPVVNLGANDTICINHTLLITPSAAFTTYQWSTGASSQTITINGSVIGVGVHPIWLRVTNADGCLATDTIVITVDPCNGIPTKSDDKQISIYPNPTNGQVWVNINGMKDKNTYICLMDMSGKVIFCENNLDVSSDTFSKEYDLGNLPKGIYTFRITNQTIVKVQRVVVQ